MANGKVEFSDGLNIQETDEHIVVTIDKASNLGLSKSGKSQVVASTRGSIRVGALNLGVNAYRSA